ncbi:MAG: hypothetical protein V1801_00715 [Candidatus Falkowbacteria bacterium]
MLTGARDFKAKVVGNYKNNEAGIFSLKLRCGPNGQGFKPGHFMALEPLHNELDWFHPFSITDVDQSNGNVAILWFKIKGEDTRRYAKLRIGQYIKVRAPIGKPFPIEEYQKFDSYILVAGGIGWPGIKFLAKKLRQLEKQVTVLLGEKTRWQMVADKEFEAIGCQVKTIVEVHEKTIGLVTDLLVDELESDQGKSMIVACGPRLMLEKVMELVEPYDNKCWIVAEEMVVCGEGMCKICAVFGRDEISGQEEVKHICEDGTAFSTEWINRQKFVPEFTPAPIQRSMRKSKPMQVRLQGQEGRFLDLKFPISNGAGCLNWRGFRRTEEGALKGDIDVTHLGLYEDKGTEFSPTMGNDSPRGSKFSGGNMLNSIGRESLGIDGFIEQELPNLERLGMPCTANLSARTVEHYEKMAAKLDSTFLPAITLNISCPNVDRGDLIFGKSPEMTSELVWGVRQRTSKFLIVKLTPEADDIVAVARAAKDVGADALALINTFKGMDIDIWTRRPTIAKGTAGWSGPALIAKSIALVSRLYQADIGLPIIAIGGISSWQDAGKLILAGANVVAPATIIFNKHGIFEELYHGLLRLMKYHQANNIQDLVGRVEFQVT